jgi:hypothetical protein
VEQWLHVTWALNLPVTWALNLPVTWALNLPVTWALNLRSRWQNKAWGASPRINHKKMDRARRAGDSAVAHFAGSIVYYVRILGLAPQASSLDI